MQVPGPNVGPIAHPWVRNGVLALGWFLVFSVLFAIPIGIYIGLYNVYRAGIVPPTDWIATAIPPGLALMAVGAGAVGFVLLLSNATFGEATTDATLEQTQDVADGIQTEQEGGQK